MIMLAFVFAEVQDFERAERLSSALQLALDADEPLARGVDGELAQVADDPFAAELFSHGGRRARAAEEIGDDVVFVG